MSEVASTTAPEVLVFIHVVAKCPSCDQKIERQTRLDEASLSTGNTTQQASYHAHSMKSHVRFEAEDRGWTAEKCGRCRDKPRSGQSSGKAGT